MTIKSPSENLRDSLNARTRKTLIQSGANIGHLTEAEKKTPSQKRSENMRKKLNRNVITAAQPSQHDCNNCEKYPCGQTLKTCGLLSRTNRCDKCGTRTTYRFVAEGEWKYCLPCRSSFK